MDYTSKRINRLIKDGFIRSEAEYLATVPIDTPDMRRIRRYRKMQKKEAEKAGLTDNAYYNYLIDSYRAQKWVDDKGNIQPDKWYATVSDEVRFKKPKERKNYAIQPNLYSSYTAIQENTKLSSNETYKLIEMYPLTEWVKRERDYQYLINHHYSPTEARMIVYAWTRDGRLQNLDLNDPAWKTNTKEHENWYSLYTQEQMQRGLTKDEAYRAAMSIINDRIKQDKSAPWSNIDIISPRGPAKPLISDFVAAANERRKRLDKQREAQLPFRVAR